MTDTSILKAKIATIRTEQQRLSDILKQQAGELFREASKELFETHPKLQSFTWRQYTPYFNDGETCTFSANTEYFNMKFDAPVVEGEEPEEDDDYEDEGEDFSDWSISYKLKQNPDYVITDRDRAGIAVRNFLSEFDDNDLLMMFGDHVKITVNRNGSVDQDEYDHE